MSEGLNLKLWSIFVNESQHFHEKITAAVELGENISLDSIFNNVFESLEAYNIITTINSNMIKNSTLNARKMYEEFLVCKIGILALDLELLKGYNYVMYQNLVDNLKKTIEFNFEYELETFKSRFTENYTPYEIHIMQGKKEEEYNHWY